MELQQSVAEAVNLGIATQDLFALLWSPTFPHVPPLAVASMTPKMALRTVRTLALLYRAVADPHPSSDLREALQHIAKSAEHGLKDCDLVGFFHRVLRTVAALEEGVIATLQGRVQTEKLEKLAKRITPGDDEAVRLFAFHEPGVGPMFRIEGPRVFFHYAQRADDGRGRCNLPSGMQVKPHLDPALETITWGDLTQRRGLTVTDAAEGRKLACDQTGDAAACLAADACTEEFEEIDRNTTDIVDPVLREALIAACRNRRLAVSRQQALQRFVDTHQAIEQLDRLGSPGGESPGGELDDRRRAQAELDAQLAQDTADHPQQTSLVLRFIDTYRAELIPRLLETVDVWGRRYIGVGWTMLKYAMKMGLSGLVALYKSLVRPLFRYLDPLVALWKSTAATVSNFYATLKEYAKSLYKTASSTVATQLSPESLDVWWIRLKTLYSLMINLFWYVTDRVRALIKEHPSTQVLIYRVVKQFIVNGCAYVKEWVHEMRNNGQPSTVLDLIAATDADVVLLEQMLDGATRNYSRAAGFVFKKSIGRLIPGMSTFLSDMVGGIPFVQGAAKQMESLLGELTVTAQVAFETVMNYELIKDFVFEEKLGFDVVLQCARVTTTTFRVMDLKTQKPRSGRVLTAAEFPQLWGLLAKHTARLGLVQSLHISQQIMIYGMATLWRPTTPPMEFVQELLRVIASTSADKARKAFKAAAGIASDLFVGAWESIKALAGAAYGEISGLILKASQWVRESVDAAAEGVWAAVRSAAAMVWFKFMQGCAMFINALVDGFPMPGFVRDRLRIEMAGPLTDDEPQVDVFKDSGLTVATWLWPWNLAGDGSYIIKIKGEKQYWRKDKRGTEGAFAPFNDDPSALFCCDTLRAQPGAPTSWTNNQIALLESQIT